MKKLIYVAVLTAMGLMAISCDADSVDSMVNESKKKPVQHGIENMTLRETDSISLDTLMTTLVNDPGPGDDPIPVPPPPPPKP
ncbi:hypothetical protein NAT51_03100 [Flavobacterium amniphilum]|uniref:hypothetical protein n=1 Tax=Flavobacterium amniphilum TaxID=1834035 RepID=UPI002029E850|nr:hypothetical protein [Flavobacterium amniphilum]MCL9804492.1 hypothetical protein [Flavobacterium amniphilum]